jgi:hypothetical protein
MTLCFGTVCVEALYFSLFAVLSPKAPDFAA